ncbi:MAG: N-acetylglucosamine-6-phosphate deacetylase, partial [Gemmatimonadales bacterium]
MEAPGADRLDARSLTAGPGFVDVHVHGGGGHSFFSSEAANVANYAAWAPRNGVTGFLVSTVGRDAAETERTFAALAPTIGHGPGAEPLGFHMEGPFINPERKGAFHPNMLRAPRVAEFERFQAAAGGHIRQVTFAPELPGALDLARAIAASGAISSVGHTDATAGEAAAGFDAGARHVTHLFNAMRPLHQREGGPIAACLLEERATCELICDGAHVAPEVLRMAYRVLGPARTVIVTDNLHIAGTSEAGGTFGGQGVEVSGAKAVRSDGTIVGSVATMDQHFRNAVAWLGIDLATAFRICSTNPARVAGAQQRKGAIERGM